MIQDRWYQTKAIDSIFNYNASGQVGNPVVAMPTATGISIVIAKFIHKVLTHWPRQRIIKLTHVKQLIEQNAKKMREVWPDVPLGIYSAGLSERDTIQPVVFGGVQSVVNCVERFGWRDLMLIDEAHLLSPKDNTSYQKIIYKLKSINPNLKVIGFTATPYRLGQGMITDDGIFTDICYDLTSLDNFNRLIDEGYLAPLIPRPTNIELDASSVGISKGDFKQNELQAAVDKD